MSLLTPTTPAEPALPRLELSANGEPAEISSGEEGGTQPGARIRRAVFALFIVHIVFLSLWPGAHRALISNLLQLVIGLGTMAVCYAYARSADSRFWRLTGASFLLWNASLIVSIFYENVLQASTTTWWPSDLLFFITPAPLLLNAFDDAGEQRRIGFIDVLQVVTVAVAIYVCFIFLPWKSLGDSVAFGLLDWKVFVVRDTVLFLLLLGRLWRDRAWTSSGAVTAFMLAAGLGEGFYVYFQALNRLHSGTLADLVWSAPFVVALAVARQPQRRLRAPGPELKGTLFYGSLALHAGLLAAMLFSVTTFTGAQLHVAQAGLVFSFFLFAIRMVRVHRALAGKIEQVQILNQDLEARVQERTGQLQAANRDLQRQNAEISRLARLKSRFMASVSHEFRTPLNALIGFSSLLLSGNGSDAAKQRQYLEHVHKSATGLSGLVNDVLDYSDLDAGDVRLSLAACSLNHLCHEVVTGIEPVLIEKQLRAGCRVAEVMVMADEKRLRQILINLLSTSMQFTPPGGTIQLTADHLQGIAEVRIHGDGPGIPVEYMSEVFGEFSQLGPDREKQIAGPGLRLALGRKLVEMHGGRIHVENDSGKGMSFVFTLKTADR